MLDLLPEEETSVANFVDQEQRVAFFGNGVSSLERLNATVGRLSRTSIAVSIDLKSGTVPEAFGGDVICIDAGNDPVGQDDPLLVKLALLDMVARQRGIGVVANAGPEMLDALAAIMMGPGVTLLCQATDSDWAVALALAEGRPVRLQQTSTEESVRLQRLSEEVQRMAGMLSELIEKRGDGYSGFREAAPGFRAPPDTYRSGPAPVVTAEDVRGIVRLRRMRERYFPPDLFADPAWDMLLDLMVARIEKSAIAVSSLCIAAAVPPTTALRWIKTMTENGMFVRVADPEDGRRVFIELAEPTAEAMMNYLAAAKAQGGLAV